MSPTNKMAAPMEDVENMENRNSIHERDNTGKVTLSKELLHNDQGNGLQAIIK